MNKAQSIFVISILSSVLLCIGQFNLLAERENPCIPRMVLLGKGLVPFDPTMIEAVAINSSYVNQISIILKNKNTIDVFAAEYPLSNVKKLQDGRILAFDVASNLYLLSSIGVLITKLSLAMSPDVSRNQTRVNATQELKDGYLLVALVNSFGIERPGFAVSLLKLEGDNVKVINTYLSLDYEWALANGQSIAQLENGLVVVLRIQKNIVFLDPTDNGKIIVSANLDNVKGVRSVSINPADKNEVIVTSLLADGSAIVDDFFKLDNRDPSQLIRRARQNHQAIKK
ncbi:MAG: hypothetical protein JWQ35_1962 [Bacteriovoracaceae bacterium]|nr:hypothetical protein [Bacteriovoracaceae bacterium]